MLRRALARLVLRVIGPELRAEAKRIAEAEANYAGAVALTISERKLCAAVDLLGGQNVETLKVTAQAFAQRDLLIDRIIASLRADALPGERTPAREDAAFEIVPPEKLH